MKTKTILFGCLSGMLLFAAACSDSDLYSRDETSPTVGIDDTSLTFDGKAEEAKILIKTNIWWKAHVEYDGGEEWLTITPSEGFGNIEITVSTERNYDLTKAKTARLVIESDDDKSSFRKEFDVKQNPSEPYIELAGIEDGTLSTSVTRSETELTLYTNDAWEAESADEGWCSVVSDGNEKGKQTVKLVCQLNATHAERSTRVTFHSKSDASVSYAFDVIQSGTFDAPELTLQKDDQGQILLSWNAIMGAMKYTVVLVNGENPIAEIDNGTELTCNLSTNEVFAKPLYAGEFEVYIHAASDDPTIYSDSNREKANSHFASGSGTREDPFVVDADHYLRNIALVNDVAGNCCYRLDYTPAPGDDFEPLCTPSSPFKGIFDGNGKTISGWSIRPMATDRNYFGLFGGIAEGGEVSNLTFSDCSLYITTAGGQVNKENNGFAWVAAVNAGSIHDITVSNCTIGCETGASPLNVGGIAAVNNGKIANCHTSGAISAATDRNKTDVFDCGGIAAYNNSSAVIENCVNDASITAMNQVGGIVGMNGGSVYGSVNNGAITANYYFGGVVGHTTSSSATCVIERCGNTGTLTMSEPSGQGRGAAYLGGIISRIYSSNTTISKCYNTGDLIVGTSVSSSSMRIGGLVGQTNKAGKLLDSYNTGSATINGKANYGGIVGEMADQAVTVSNCYTSGNVTADGGSGNLCLAFGKASGSATVSGCYALDTGAGIEFAGGTTSGIVGSGVLTDAQMKDQTSFVGWDFSTIWQITAGSYPTLR